MSTATGNQDAGTQTGENTEGENTEENQDLNNQNAENQDGGGEGEGSNENLPKTQKELDELLKKRLNRQQQALDKKYKADLKKVQDQKDLSEVELEKKRNTDLKTRIVEKNFGLAARDAGAATGVEKLHRLYAADLETDDEGEITNIDDVLADAKKDFPELFKRKGSADGGKGGNDDLKDPSAAWNKAIKSQLGY